MTDKVRLTRSFVQTVKFYRELREVTHRMTENEFSGFGIRASEIRMVDAMEADRWTWSDSQKTPIWSWGRMFSAYRSPRGVKRFDIAIHSAGILRGLAYGIPSRRRLLLKLHVVTGSPHRNPLQGHVFRIVLFAAGTYATFLGSQELWLVKPQTEGVASHYARFGFEYHRTRDGHTTHMVKKV